MSELFLHPGMLVGLVAVTVPILLYLLERRPAQEVRWAAQALLEKAIDAAARQARRRELLLLLTRVALVAVIALACATPLLPVAGWQRYLGAESMPIVLVLDGSASMHAIEQDGRTRFDHARTRALEEIGGAEGVVSVSLVLAGTRPALLARDVRSRETIREALTAAQPGYGAVDRAALDEILDEMPGSAQVLWITDGAGATPWSPKRGRTVVVAGPGPANRAVRDVAIAAVDSRVGRYRVSATIVETSGGTDESTDTTATLEVDGEDRERIAVKIDEHGEARVAFDTLLVGRDPMVVTVRVAGDAYSLDDRRSLVHQPAETRRVALVSSPSSPPHLLVALEAIEAAGATERPIRLSVHDPAALRVPAAGDSELAEVDALLIAGDAGFGPNAVAAIRAAATAGTPIAWFVDPDLDGSIADELASILHVRLGRAHTANDDEGISIETARADHPLLRRVLAAQPAAIDTARVTRYREIAPVTDGAPAADVVASFTPDRGAAIVAFHDGRFVLALSPDPRDSDLAVPSGRGHLLLPLAASLLDTMALNASPALDRVCGAPLGRPASWGDLALVGPDGTAVDEEGFADAGPGVYRIRDAGRDAGLVTLRPEASESEIAPTIATDRARPGTVRRAGFRWPLLAAAAILILLETWLAARGSRREVTS